MPYQYKQRSSGQHRPQSDAENQQGISLRPPNIHHVLQRDADAQGTGKTQTVRKDYVFIMGQDSPGSKNPFYTEATGYFQQKYPKATLVKNLRDLHAVLSYIKGLPNNTMVGQLFLVTHAHRTGRVSFGLNAKDTDKHIGENELKNGLGNLPNVSKKIDAQSVIRIKGCNMGRNKEMVELFDKAFGGGGQVIGSTHEQVYSHKTAGGKTTYQESLSGPTLERPGKKKFKKSEVKAFVNKHYGHLSKAQKNTLTNQLFAAQKVETRTNEAFGGQVPSTKKQAMNAFKSTLKKNGFAASACTSISKATQGGTTTITYTFSGKYNGQTASMPINVDVPTEASAIADMKGKEEVSERYDFTAKSTQKGSNLTIKVTQSRVIAYLHHRGLDASSAKPFQPPESDAFFYTKSN